MLDIGRSKLYQDAKDGVISTETGERGRKVVDTAELERVYGKLRNPVDNPEPSEVVRLLEEQVSTLQEQLTQAGEREKALIAEKERLTVHEDKLINMLESEQEKTRLLMLPATEKKRSWLDRLMG